MANCDVCGQTATSVTVDAEETEPQNGFRCWKPKGEPRVRCDEHVAACTLYYKDGWIEPLVYGWTPTHG